MAAKATIHNVEVEISDVDRGVYESLSLCLARQPSETAPYMVTRLLAYCLEYREGIAFTEGSRREPAGRARARPHPPDDRVDRGRHAGRGSAPPRGESGGARRGLHAARPRTARPAARGRENPPGRQIPIFAFDLGFVDAIAESIDRRSRFSLSVTERHLYVELDGKTFETSISERRIAPPA